ncbi:hypothetical protein [Actinoplanes derwentensis]|uniref:Uncharacterized protein n=1 Tax=Actinoplanes derwentensis TaxID=113562 RepID=A0A1H1RNG1_9ACTN|nr:hypothetical protein [Actinoplanes derwentensis]SDS37235.1 hypothetical protein SAMN04489716_0640 [Actinoplanes derwentensis]
MGTAALALLAILDAECINLERLTTRQPYDEMKAFPTPAGL